MLEKSALKTIYDSQFLLSTQLIILNYPAHSQYTITPLQKQLRPTVFTRFLIKAVGFNPAS